MATKKLAKRTRQSDHSSHAQKPARQRKLKMITFVLDQDLGITACAPGDSALSAEDVITFTNQSEFAKAAAKFPGPKMVEMFNGIPGQKQVKKFTDQKTAVKRIWAAIQTLATGLEEEAVAAKEAPVATTAAAATKRAPGAKKAKVAKEPKVREAKTTGDASNKKAQVLSLMQRSKGATLAEITEATGWQKHTVRGFVSILGSKHGYAIESLKSEAGERTYKLAK